MKDLEILFPEINYRLPLVFVKGTGNSTYLFGDGVKVDTRIGDFLISKYPVTQKLWEHIMGNNQSYFKGENRPVENISFNEITDNGFLDRLNFVAKSKYQSDIAVNFRLPSETEWEYAARGGTHWRDGFQFSGGDDINTLGWYDQNSGKYKDPEIISRLKNQEKGTQTHDVGQKLPNQLGIYDMSGNVWEWCQDYFQNDIDKIPGDGTPYSNKTGERVLRGGCHHNWAIHCTVSKRYEIAPDAKDECIGFRIAASI